MKAHGVAINVREASLADSETLTEGNILLAQETEGLVLDTSVVRQGVRAALEDPLKALYFVAEIDGQVAGQLMITREWSDWRNADIWWVQSVYVWREHRRAGVFRELYSYVRDLARSSGCAGIRLYVESQNEKAQATYRSLGLDSTHYQLMEEMFESGSQAEPGQ